MHNIEGCKQKTPPTSSLTTSPATKTTTTTTFTSTTATIYAPKILTRSATIGVRKGDDFNLTCIADVLGK